jgi:hypothetical protein
MKLYEDKPTPKENEILERAKSNYANLKQAYADYPSVIKNWSVQLLIAAINAIDRDSVKFLKGKILESVIGASIAQSMNELLENQQQKASPKQTVINPAQSEIRDPGKR